MFDVLNDLFGTYEPYLITETVKICIDHAGDIFNHAVDGFYHAAEEGLHISEPFFVPNPGVCTDICVYELTDKVTGTATNWGYIARAGFITFFMGQVFMILRMLVRGISRA